MTQNTQTETESVTLVKLPVQALREALSVFRKIAVKNSMPVLNCVFFEDGMMRASDLDQEVRWRGRIPASFRMALPFKELAEAVKGPKGTETVVIGHHPDKPGLAVVNHSQCKHTIKQMPFKEVPAASYGVNPGDPVLFDTLDADLPDLLRSASEDENRYILNGVFFDREYGRLVATNGRQMLIIPCGETKQLTESIVVPSKVASLLHCKPLKQRPASIQLAKRSRKKGADTIAHFILGDGEWEITTKLVEGNYPNYRQVIPDWDAADTYTAFFNKAQAEAIMRFLKSLPKDEKVTKLAFNGPELTITHMKGDEGATVELSGVMTPNTDKRIEAAFNHGYLVDALETGCLTWRLKDELSPLLATGQDQRKAIVMPLRLK